MAHFKEQKDITLKDNNDVNSAYRISVVPVPSSSLTLEEFDTVKSSKIDQGVQKEHKPGVRFIEQIDIDIKSK